MNDPRERKAMDIEDTIFKALQSSPVLSVEKIATDDAGNTILSVIDTSTWVHVHLTVQPAFRRK